MTPAVALIKKYEGFRSTPYLCPANVPTIGYGTTVYPDGRKVSLTDKPVREAQAELFLEHEVAKCAQAIRSLIKVPVTDNQRAALISFAYNVGVGALKSSTLLKMLNAGDTHGAAQQFKRWTRGGGKVLNGLVRRREEEMELFLT